MRKASGIDDEGVMRPGQQGGHSFPEEHEHKKPINEIQQRAQDVILAKPTAQLSVLFLPKQPLPQSFDTHCCTLLTQALG
jgi:hypothetical protein